MKLRLAAATAIVCLSAPVFAGDAAKGEKEFKKCRSCHEVVATDGTVIVKGGKTGPNLYGVIGRAAGSYEGYTYGDSMVTAAAGGLVWDEASVAAFATDPKAYLAEITGDAGAKTQMSFKLKKGADDVAAFLASVAPASN